MRPERYPIKLIPESYEIDDNIFNVSVVSRFRQRLRYANLRVDTPNYFRYGFYQTTKKSYIK